MTELRMISAIAGIWGLPTCQLRGFVSICRNQLRKVEIPNIETALIHCDLVDMPRVRTLAR